MKHTAAEAFAIAKATAVAAIEVELAIERALDEIWPERGHPQITAFTHEGTQDDWSDIALTVELDRDLELPFEMPDAAVMALLHGDVDGIGFAAYVAAACADALAHADVLRAAQDAMRARCEAFCRDLKGRGLDLALHWISLAPHDHWLRPAEVRFDIALQGLGENLRPAEVRGEAGAGDDLAEAFDHALDEQARLAAMAAADVAAGADGRIDAVALAVVNAQPDPHRTLFETTLTERLELPDGSELKWRGGVLTSAGELPCGGEWYGRHVELPGRWSARSVTAAMEGGPASAITDHPALAELTLRAVTSELVGCKPMTTAVLDAPVSFFDVQTGLFWPVDGARPHQGTGWGSGAHSVRPTIHGQTSSEQRTGGKSRPPARRPTPTGESK